MMSPRQYKVEMSPMQIITFVLNLYTSHALRGLLSAPNWGKKQLGAIPRKGGISIA